MELRKTLRFLNSTSTSISLVTFVLFAIFIKFGASTEPTCCERVSGSCAGVCKQLSLENLASDDQDSRDKLLRPLNQHCPSHLTRFWDCMNETLTGLYEGSHWEGRFCCPIALTRICQISCLTGSQISDLNGCRRSDESALYQCFERIEDNVKCCSRTERSECTSACLAYLQESSPGVVQNRRQGIRKRFNSHCEKDSAVLACVSNKTHSSPVHNAERNLPCCARGRNQECQEGCRRALKSGTSDRAIMDLLVEKNCGQPRPDDKLWQCFLQNAEPRGTELPSRIDKLGMDTAKLHCCHRANSPTCRKLCHKTYTREWTGSWADLDRICLSSSTEPALRSCVDEVEEPCELGCEGLSFCSTFNNRPSELFRRCSPVADNAAKEQYQQWLSLGYIPLSESMNLPLKDLSKCATDKWKAVACALQLKPCHPKTHASQICRSDCISLLNECVDFDGRFLHGGYDVSYICELLSPPPGSACISISSYIPHKTAELIPKFSHKQEISRPCKSRPCTNNSEICQVNRNCPSGNCPSPFTCTRGCSLGEVSKIIVQPETWLRVPSHNYGCQRLCKCNGEGRMENCGPQVCEAPSPCWLGRTHIEHSSHFWLDCNLCSCRSGELICSKRQCPQTVESSNFLFGTSKSTELSLPCKCPPVRSPVCGSNGKTYHSSCLAKCGGLTDADITVGECAAIDPCDGVTCDPGKRCIRTRKVCLIPMSRKCHQYTCVPVKCDNDKTFKPVCDTSLRQHRNLCQLSADGAMLSYRGPCLRSGSCSTSGPVCGINGETYLSECGAEAEGMAVDYKGVCRYIGTGDGSSLQPSCTRVKCPELPPNCIGVTPAGSCCPVCGGVLRVLFSPIQVLRIADTTDSQLITIEDIRERLSSLVQTAQCRTGVYLGLGTELIVIVRPIKSSSSFSSNNKNDISTPLWTKVQIQACISETQRLATLITQQNPIVQVDASLSVLVAASTNHYQNGASSQLSRSNLSLYLIGFIFIGKIFLNSNSRL